MIPSLQQRQLLQNNLKDKLTYRETYEEVYDHILSALENEPDDIAIGDAINKIIHNDFGGFIGLKRIEKKRRWLVGRQMAKKQLWYLFDHIKFPLLPITLIIYASLYYFVINVKFDGFRMFLVIGLLPSLFNGLRYFTIGYKFKSTQKSINDLPFKILSSIPYYFFFIGSVICQAIYYRNVPGHDFLGFYNLPPLILSSFYTLYLIYHLSFFRLYRDEFAKLEVE